jgi:hypothetical protein
MTKVRHDKESKLVHGLALGFRTGRVSTSLSFCHGGSLLWRTKTMWVVKQRLKDLVDYQIMKSKSKNQMGMSF